MSLSEAIEAVGNMLGRYANGGAQAGDSYIGALAATLCSYPRQVAIRCAERGGVTSQCKFLPADADVIAWCEKAVTPLHREFDHDNRVRRQFEEREEFQSEQGSRSRRLSIEELKEKYGDWRDDWRSPGTKARELCEQARQRLVGEIGEEAFSALPEAAE